MSHVRVCHRKQNTKNDRESAKNAGTRSELTQGLIAEELGISKDTVHTIIRDNLGKRKICSQIEQCKLSDEQKTKRMENSGDFIFMCDQNPFLLENVVTGDGTWCYQFDPESKRQLMVLCTPTSPRPKKESSAKIQGQNTVGRLLQQKRHHP